MEIFSLFPTMKHNQFEKLTQYERNDVLRPSDSSGSLRKYIMKNNLELQSQEFFYLRKSIHEGESSLSIGFQNLHDGIKFFGIYRYESREEYLRIPGISYEDGINLAIQIVGHHLKSFTLENGVAKLDMSYNHEHYIRIEKHEKGFIQIVEVSSI
jgi:hypothetical protein